MSKASFADMVAYHRRMFASHARLAERHAQMGLAHSAAVSTKRAQHHEAKMDELVERLAASCYRLTQH